MAWMKLALIAALSASVACTPPALADATLSLEYVGGEGPFAPGQMVQVRLRMSDIPLLTPAAGFQAFVQYDTQRLLFVGGTYTTTPFNQHIITPIAARGGEIAMAAGINIFGGALPTSADATVANLTFQAQTLCGTGAIEFIAHQPPNTLSTLAGLPVLPLQLNSIQPTVLCPPDQTLDDLVNVNDLLLVIVHWGACPPSEPCCPGDVNLSSEVDVNDLLAVIVNWGPCP